jgi:hypothetical protein
MDSGRGQNGSSVFHQWESRQELISANGGYSALIVDSKIMLS